MLRRKQRLIRLKIGLSKGLDMQQVIEQRWPAVWQAIQNCTPYPNTALVEDTPEQTLVINGLHLTSAYNRQQEAELQSQLVPEDAVSACIYGFALGDLARELLKRKTLKELVVVLLAPEVVHWSLKHFDHSDWLNDARVTLKLAQDERQLRLPFCVAPACLRLANDVSTKLKDQIMIELNRVCLQRYFHNMAHEFEKHINDNIDFCKSDNDVALLFNTRKDAQAVIIAGGPTAEEQFDWVKQHRSELLVISVNTAVIPLQQVNITPDIVVVVDHK